MPAGSAYSACRVTMGSTRLARRAGIMAARHVTSSSVKAVPASTPTSLGVTPSRKAARARRAGRARRAPSPRPATVTRTASHTTCRATRRPTFQRESLLTFYSREAWRTARTWVSAGLYYLELNRTRKQIERDPLAKEYTDQSLTPVRPEELAVVEADEGCGTCETEPAVVPLTVPVAPVRRAA